MKAKDFMITDVIAANEQDTVKQVLKTFVDRRISGMPILDKDRRIVGVVSDGDILRGIQPKDAVVFNYLLTVSFKAEKIDKIVDELKDHPILNLAKKRGIVTVHEDDEMEDVVNILAKHRFKKIPVVNDQKQVVGVISRGDVLRTIHSTLLHAL
ncbi:CBS domain-containing protein [Terribacillus halophilus]|uniref:CBS domain-containing protein n=1 Tax=Terribacillus halophilus TaxID=361279 RepID=A0A1G6VEA3_9BACI|nr:CBS domain-containing protein [Terribacillus halophilus]SDD51831.1 CBS domain-containing protein [Terribacillus halophilus]